MIQYNVSNSMLANAVKVRYINDCYLICLLTSMIINTDNPWKKVTNDNST